MVYQFKCKEIFMYEVGEKKMQINKGHHPLIHWNWKRQMDKTKMFLSLNPCFAEKENPSENREGHWCDKRCGHQLDSSGDSQCHEYVHVMPDVLTDWIRLSDLSQYPLFLYPVRKYSHRTFLFCINEATINWSLPLVFQIRLPLKHLHGNEPRGRLEQINKTVPFHPSSYCPSGFQS